MTSPGSRVVLVSHAARPNVRRIRNYAEFLIDHGYEVDLIAWDEKRWLDFEIPLPDAVRFFAVRESELRLLIRRVERLVIYRIPGKILRVLSEVTQSNPVTRPLAPAVSFAQRGHKWFASRFHRRIFLPMYAVVRAPLMARSTARALNGVEFSDVDRVVATDVNAITYAWRLASKFPHAAVAARLDRHPYLRPGEQDDVAISAAAG